INPQLSAIAEHNAYQLGKDNIQFIIGNGLEYFLNENKKIFDVIFIDPSRRVNTKKVFKLDDCEPNIIQYQEQLFEKSNRIIIKTSPLLDISLSVSQLKNV